MIAMSGTIADWAGENHESSCGGIGPGGAEFIDAVGMES
jgi:hypothetical protein